MFSLTIKIILYEMETDKIKSNSHMHIIIIGK